MMRSLFYSAAAVNMDMHLLLFLLRYAQCQHGCLFNT